MTFCHRHVIPLSDRRAQVTHKQGGIRSTGAGCGNADRAGGCGSREVKAGNDSRPLRLAAPGDGVG